MTRIYTIEYKTCVDETGERIDVPWQNYRKAYATKEAAQEQIDRLEEFKPELEETIYFIKCRVVGFYHPTFFICVRPVHCRSIVAFETLL